MLDIFVESINVAKTLLLFLVYFWLLSCKNTHNLLTWLDYSFDVLDIIYMDKCSLKFLIEQYNIFFLIINILEQKNI